MTLQISHRTELELISPVCFVNVYDVEGEGKLATVHNQVPHHEGAFVA
jgi:hypothetical protein